MDNSKPARSYSRANIARRLSNAVSTTRQILDENIPRPRSSARNQTFPSQTQNATATSPVEPMTTPETRSNAQESRKLRSHKSFGSLGVMLDDLRGHKRERESSSTMINDNTVKPQVRRSQRTARGILQKLAPASLKRPRQPSNPPSQSKRIEEEHGSDLRGTDWTSSCVNGETPLYSGGYAARAAAAAANVEEPTTDTLAPSISSESQRFHTPNASLYALQEPDECESGIGFNNTDEEHDLDVDESLFDKTPRFDPATYLPEELFSQILSELDTARDLRSAQLVSWRWYASASTDRVYESAFRKKYIAPLEQDCEAQGMDLLPNSGIGRHNKWNQWKNMSLARKMVEDNWTAGRYVQTTLFGHRDCVYCVQFDDHKIVTGSRDRTIRVWDMHTYKCMLVLGIPTSSNGLVYGQFEGDIDPTPVEDQHKGSILCLQYDDDLLVTGSSDATLKVWDIKTWTPIAKITTHKMPVLDICMDQRFIITASKDASIHVHNRNDYSLIRRLGVNEGPVNAICLKGDVLASASGDGTARLFNVVTGTPLATFGCQQIGGLACVEFQLSSSPDEDCKLWAGGSSAKIYEFSFPRSILLRDQVATPQGLVAPAPQIPADHCISVHTKLVRSLYRDRGTNILISGSYDSSLLAMNLDAQYPISRTKKGVKPLASAMKFTKSWVLRAKSDYRRIVAVSQDKGVTVLDFGKRHLTQAEERCVLWELKTSLYGEGTFQVESGEWRAEREWLAERGVVHTNSVDDEEKENADKVVLAVDIDGVEYLESPF